VTWVLGVVLALGVSTSPVEARKPCSLKSCRGAIKARCAGLKGKAKRICRRGIISACKAGECSCTGGIPSCAEPPTTTTTTVTTTSTTSTTIVSGPCLTDTGDGTIHDSCTGLQWEKKANTAGLQNVNTLYSWAGCCNGDCSTVANLCQPNAAAAATCAANSDGGTQGCSTCASGTCNVDPDLTGAPTTVWDWINQVNAAGFAGHSDWRLPSEAGNNAPSGAKDLETVVDMTATGCGLGSPCIDPIFGPTIADAYFSATTITSSTSMAWSVTFNSGNVGSGSKQDGFYIRAVR
jgi:hypothetical protein